MSARDFDLLISKELFRIAEKFESASKAIYKAKDIMDSTDAEWQMTEAQGEYQAASGMLADLFFLMLRHALLSDKGETLKSYLKELLKRPDRKPAALHKPANGVTSPPQRKGA